MDPIPAMKIVARIQSEFPQKFGIPRQSGLVEELKAAIVFEPEYRIPQALRGLEGFSHIWLIWLFSEAAQSGWSPTVRPPRLGGNTRMGVFATRSPFRPNPIGLSAVRLDGVRQDEKLGPVLLVSGADLMDGTPILDIKPYLPFADAIRWQAEALPSKSGVYIYRWTFPLPCWIRFQRGIGERLSVCWHRTRARLTIRTRSGSMGWHSRALK